MQTPINTFREAAINAGYEVKPIHEVDNTLPPGDEDTVLVAVNPATGHVHGAFNLFHHVGLDWFIQKGKGWNFNKPAERDAVYARMIDA